MLAQGHRLCFLWPVGVVELDDKPALTVVGTGVPGSGVPFEDTGGEVGPSAEVGELAFPAPTVASVLTVVGSDVVEEEELVSRRDVWHAHCRPHHAVPAPVNISVKTGSRHAEV